MANKKYFFRVPKTQSEAIYRRNTAISRLKELAFEINVLTEERSNLKTEIEQLNKGLKVEHDQSAGAAGADEEVQGEELSCVEG